MKQRKQETNLPVLGLPGQHDSIFVLRDVIILIILGLLNGVLSLDTLVLGERTVVTLLEGS